MRASISTHLPDAPPSWLNVGGGGDDSTAIVDVALQALAQEINKTLRSSTTVDNADIGVPVMFGCTVGDDDCTQPPLDTKPPPRAPPAPAPSSNTAADGTPDGADGFIRRAAMSLGEGLLQGLSSSNSSGGSRTSPPHCRGDARPPAGVRKTTTSPSSSSAAASTAARDGGGDGEPVLAPTTAAVSQRVSDTGDVLHIAVDLPGVDHDAVTVEVTPQGGGIIVKGRRDGLFARTFNHSVSVSHLFDLDAASAEARNGLVHVKVPRRRPRSIRVSHRGDEGDDDTQE